jgi:hypothetical protein
MLSPYIFKFATDFRSIAGQCRFQNLQFAFLKLTKPYGLFGVHLPLAGCKNGCAILVCSFTVVDKQDTE